MSSSGLYFQLQERWGRKNPEGKGEPLAYIIASYREGSPCREIMLRHGAVVTLLWLQIMSQMKTKQHSIYSWSRTVWAVYQPGGLHSSSVPLRVWLLWKHPETPVSVKTSELVGKAGLTGTRKAGDNCKKSITGSTGGLLVTRRKKHLTIQKTMLQGLILRTMSQSSQMMFERQR